MILAMPYDLLHPVFVYITVFLKLNLTTLHLTGKKGYKGIKDNVYSGILFTVSHKAVRS